MEKTFGEFLKEKRLAKNLTQKNIADTLYVSESAVSKWEKDVAHPDITLLPALAKMLGVTEHELLTASIDHENRTATVQAKKWRSLTFSWNLFFFISYGIALLTCFIVNIAVDKTLNWFFVVLFSLVLSATFTTTPQYIKCKRALFIPLSELLALIILFGVICLYTSGKWFILASVCTTVGILIIFIPIWLSKYAPPKIKKANAFISLALSYILLFAMLFVIQCYTQGDWCFDFALPILSIVFAVILLCVSAKFIKLNRLIKSGIIVFIANAIITFSPYYLTDFINGKFPDAKAEIYNVFKANFHNWQNGTTISDNVGALITLSMLLISVILLVFGLIKSDKNK